MPLLDIEVQVKDNKLLHVFYKKAVSNPLLISKNSAMPFRVSGSQATQEILEILSEFSHKLMLSGWDAMSCYDFILAGVRGYQKQLERADAGLWDWDREARDRKTSRYRPQDAVMFVPATPNSEPRDKI